MKLDENKVINIHTEGTKNVHAKFYSLWEQLLENKKNMIKHKSAGKLSQSVQRISESFNRLGALGEKSSNLARLIIKI